MDALVRSSRADRLFAETATLGRYLTVEVALAEVQADLGVIPPEAARSIAAAATVEAIDRARYRASFETVGFPIVGLVEQLAEVVPDGLGQYAHWGATTQDVMDTALVLALQQALDWAEAELDAVINALADLAETHRRTPMIGRSQMQQAVPITFGAKVAGWLDALARHRQRLRQLRPRLLRVQFGGAVGTLASLGPVGVEVRERLAERLGLASPLVSWHTHRDGLAEFVAAFGLLTATLGKLATDVILMAQTEIGEVSEAADGERGTSSTMPQKRNPVVSQQILVAARLMAPLVAGVLTASVQDHERGTATWQMEWSLVPDAVAYTLGALEHARELATGLDVNPDRMRENLDRTNGLIYAEAAMMTLAPAVGRQRAHELVAAAVRRVEPGESLLDVMERSPEIADAVSPEALRGAFSGEVHTEMADNATRDVLSALAET